MTVYALVGKSGTGKSHHCMWVARENKIEYIVDDGLLICDNKIVAGQYAKRESTKIASVKCAIFNDPVHAKSVGDALRNNNASSVLLIGTSERMVNQIAERLGIDHIDKIFQIEDVVTPEEIKLAEQMRMTEGKHVIPVPTFELKRQFSGYFKDPLMLLFKKSDQPTIMEEKTVMRPSYSYLGEYKISPKAIADICNYEAKRFSSIHKVLRVRNSTTPGGRLMLEIDVILNYPCRVAEQAELYPQEYLNQLKSLHPLRSDGCI